MTSIRPKMYQDALSNSSSLAHSFYRLSHPGHCDHALSFRIIFLLIVLIAGSNGQHDGDDGPVLRNSRLFDKNQCHC